MLAPLVIEAIQWRFAVARLRFADEAQDDIADFRWGAEHWSWSATTSKIQTPVKGRSTQALLARLDRSRRGRREFTPASLDIFNATAYRSRSRRCAVLRLKATLARGVGSGFVGLAG